MLLLSFIVESSQTSICILLFISPNELFNKFFVAILFKSSSVLNPLLFIFILFSSSFFFLFIALPNIGNSSLLPYSSSYFSTKSWKLPTLNSPLSKILFFLFFSFTTVSYCFFIWEDKCKNNLLFLFMDFSSFFDSSFSFFSFSLFDIFEIKFINVGFSCFTFFLAEVGE